MKRIMHMWRGGFLMLSLLAVLPGCQAVESQNSKAEVQPTALQRNPLEITAEMLLLEQLTVGEVSWSDVHESVSVPARVEVDDTRVTRVGAPITGRVTELLVHEGQTVERGQVLVKLYSTSLVDVQLGFLKAHSQRSLAERAVARAQQLLRAEVIGSAELQRREAELAQTTAEVVAARQQLEVLGMPATSIKELERTHLVNSTTQIVASMDGTILERKVTLGQVVQPAETVVVVADLSHVWMIAEVPEQSAGAIRRGHRVQAEIPALPGSVVSGTLSFVSPTVNPETRTVRVRMDLPNPHGQFKPAMLAKMTLQDHAVRQQVVPSTAVVREGDKEHVFVQISPDKFVLRQVELGPEFQNKRVLKNGVRPGEKIVVDGAFHLNNERRRIVAQGA
jgi:cobalt-zinc-cadmium efflux system membrane fusion protein